MDTYLNDLDWETVSNVELFKNYAHLNILVQRSVNYCKEFQF